MMPVNTPIQYLLLIGIVLLSPQTVQAAPAETPASVNGEAQIQVPVEVPVAFSGSDAAADEHQRTLILVIAATVLCLALLLILLVLIWRGRADRRSADAGVVQAFLNDTHGLSGQLAHKLGRKPTMLGRVAGSDTQRLQYIVIPENTIGRRHALIEYKDYGYWIVDQSSINGTYVNDMLVTSEMRLNHGDRIRLHKFEFEFLLADVDAFADRAVVSNTVCASDAGAGKGADTVADEEALFDTSGAADRCTARKS